MLSLRSSTPELEFLLPPGRFFIQVLGHETSGVEGVTIPVAIEPRHRLRNLGIIDVQPSKLVRRGVFFDHHHLSRADRQADLQGGQAGDDLRLRPVRWGPDLRSDAFMVHDVAYSPDGRYLATGHWNNVAQAGVKLWEAATGRLAASLAAPVEKGGVEILAFSPDGRWLAGVVGDAATPLTTWAVVIWDVASRREVKVLRGHASTITALAFARMAARLPPAARTGPCVWDVASGREAGRIDPGAKPAAIQSMAYTPDGKALAIVSRFSLRLWDVPGGRFRATLEDGDFWVNAVAIAADGRTLAAAGAILGAPAEPILNPGRREREGAPAALRPGPVSAGPSCRAGLARGGAGDGRFSHPRGWFPQRRRVHARRPSRRGHAAEGDRGLGRAVRTAARLRAAARWRGLRPAGRPAAGLWLAATENHRAQVIDLVPPGR